MDANKLIELSQDFICTTDFEGKFIFVNPSCLELFGYKPEELIGRKFIDFVHSDDIGKTVKEFENLIAGEKTLDFDNRYIHKDGSIKYISWKSTSVLTEKSVYAIGRDITDSKQVEEALLQSEATVRNKLKAISEPKGDISALTLSDIIDAEILQSIMDDFYQITGMLGAVVDVSGEVLVAVGWQDICTKFHRCNPDTLKHCIESDTILTQGVPEGTFKAYQCKNNMWDIVTPIMVGERHVGNVFMGQYFLEGDVPDIELFRKQAIKYGFDETEYLAALERVPRFSKETVNAGMQFYSKLAGIISTLSFSTIQQSKMLAERKLVEFDLIKAKVKAEENQKLYEDLVQSSHNLIWKCDLEGRFTFLNSAWENTHGYKVEEMLGRPFSDFQRPEVFERDVIEFTKHLEGGFVKDYETTHIIKDGNEIPLIFNALPLYNSLGEVIGTQGTAFDISKLKQTELNLIKAKEKAEDSEGKLLTIANNLPILISQIDNNFKYLFANQFYYDRSLFESGIIGKNVNDVIGEETFNRAFPYMQKVLSGEFVSFENRTTHTKNDELVIIDTQYIPHIVNGQVESFFVLGIDITDRKLAEDSLKASEEKFRNLAESAQVSISIVTPVIEKGVLYVNKYWEKITGYTQEESTEMGALEIVHPDHRSMVIERAKKRIAGDIVPDNYELKILTKSGQTKWVNFTATRVDFEGIPASLITAIDITEQKKAKEALVNNQKRYKKAQAMGRVGNWEYNPVTTNFWASDEAKRIYGFELDSDEFTTEKVEGCISERTRVHQALVDLIEQDKEYDLVFDILTHDKRIRKTIHSIAEVERDKQGNIIKITGVISDITISKQVENELVEAKEKAEKSDILKTMFLNNMSHEIRTPLNGILGFSKLLCKDNLEIEKKDRYSKIIHDGGVRLTRVIEDIVDISMIESNQLEIVKNKLKVADFINDIFYNHTKSERLVNKTRLKLNLENNIDVNLEIFTDGIRLGQVIDNLITNAIKYNTQGRIILKCNQ
jgi:PAS domain S-box-containing protein